MRLSEARRDYYRRLAGEQGYRSRAAFKLIQLDKKYRFLQKNSVVLDFGCAPGGWLQVASEKVGSKGFILGVDSKKIQPPSSNVTVLQDDIFSGDIASSISEILPKLADVVLSDLAPNISGIWSLDQSQQLDLNKRVVSLLSKTLDDNGVAIFKVFVGSEVKDFESSLKRIFKRVIFSKPPASRNRSSEIYLVCLGYNESLSSF